MYEYGATLVKVHDADTFRMDVDLGMRVHVMADIRLTGVYAPELSTPEGKAARDVVAEWWSWEVKSTPVTLRTVKDRKSFDRWLGILYLPGQEVSINEAITVMLTAAGLTGGTGG